MSLLDYGYADGAYQVNCIHCRKDIVADKRATSCAECAHKEAIHHLPQPEFTLSEVEALVEKSLSMQVEFSEMKISNAHLIHRRHVSGTTQIALRNSLLSVSDVMGKDDDRS